MNATGRWHRPHQAPAPAGDTQPHQPGRHNKDRWAQQMLAEPRLGRVTLIVRCAAFRAPPTSARPGMPHLAVALRGAASVVWCGLCYGVTELTDVPQLARPSLVPPQVPIALGWKAGGAQFGCWMYSLAK